MNENTIRDSLAQNLQTLEPELELIKTEYLLPNAQGTRGFIDILARDRLGNLVIIELKRSNQAARQAIHELNKYLALLIINEGIQRGSIRTMLASTEWDELRIPFGEYMQIADHQCQGFELTVDDEGNVLSAIVHTPVIIATEISFFREHSLFLYETAERREQCTSALIDNLIKIGCQGAAVGSMNYVGQSNSVVYPFGLYVVPTSIEPTAWEKHRKGVASEYDLDDALEIQLAIEDSLLAEHAQLGPDLYDDMEPGYSEKLAASTSNGWHVESWIRHGRIASSMVMSDAELLRKAAGLDQVNSVIFVKTGAPRFRTQWREIKDQIQNSLRGNSRWERVTDWYIELIQSKYPNSNVSFAIYNPQRLPQSIYALKTHDDHRFIPVLEIISQSAESVSSLFGYISWSGKTAVNVGNVLRRFGERYLNANHFGLQAKLDCALMAWLGLSYEFVLQTANTEAAPILETLRLDAKGVEVAGRFEPAQAQTLIDFVDRDETFVPLLLSWMASHIIRA